MEEIFKNQRYLQRCVIVWISMYCDILAVGYLCHCLNIKGLWQLVTWVIVWMLRDCDILVVGYLCHYLNNKGLWHTGSWLPVSLFKYQGIVTYLQLITRVIVWISRDCDILAVSNLCHCLNIKGLWHTCS